MSVRLYEQWVSACMADGQWVSTCLSRHKVCPSVRLPQWVSRCPCVSQGHWRSAGGEEESQGLGHCRVCPPARGHLALSGAHTLFHPAELVVAESVVVIKKLLQMQPAQHGEIIKHLAKLTDNIQVWAAGMPRPLPFPPHPWVLP